MFGVYSTYLDFSQEAQFWVLDLHSLGPFSRTPRTSKQRDYAKKGQSRNNPTPTSRKEGRAERNQSRPPGPGQTENLWCLFYPYLEKQKGGNRTNFIFFRYFRNSLRFQLKRKEFKLDYKKVLFHYFICKSVDFFFQEYRKFVTHFHLNETHWAGMTSTEHAVSKQVQRFLFRCTFQKMPAGCE